MLSKILSAIQLALLLTIPFGAAVAQDHPQPSAESAVDEALAADDSAGDDEGEDEEPSWDVNEPPGEWDEIEIDTTETTWSDVDISPDGGTILFDMLGDIYTVPTAGGDATALTADIAWNIQPRFSPDGSQIVFVSDRGGADNLWVMNADGSDPKAVTEESENLVHNPSWSPDGQYIVGKKGFTSTRSIPAGEIWLFHVGGGEGLQLTERPNGPQDQKTMAEPAFSPDGRYVYYSQDTTPGRVWAYNKDSTGQIFTIQRLDRETGEIETYVSGAGGAIRPVPSPDGEHLAFVKRLPGLQSALYLKNIASGKEWAIYRELERDLQETNGSQGNSTSFAWTPEGDAIVFWAGGKIRRIDIESREAAVIPVRIQATKKVAPALRFPVDVAPEEFDVKMLRWAQISPDGRTALFQALGHLYVKDLKSGKQERLTDQDEHFEFYPVFSRDGDSIVYTTWDDQKLGSIRIVSARGGEGRTVTTSPGHYVEPQFSPDGKHIVYRKLTGGYLLSPFWSVEPGIYYQSVDGDEIERVSESGFRPHFGASSERVLFSDSAGDDGTELVLKSVDLNGHDEREHLNIAKGTEVSVSPDGQWVAFTEQFNAYVAPFAPTGRAVSLGKGTSSIPVTQVSKRSGEFLHWSPAGDEIRWANGATLYRRPLSEAFSFVDGAPEELPDPVEEGLDLGFSIESDAPEGTIALTGARVVTMRDADSSEEVIENGVVIVRGNRIAAVGKMGEIEIPRKAFVVDCAGKTIIPGLVDVHAHGGMSRAEITPEQNWMQFSNLSFGVTTIHDPSNDTSSIFAAAELQRAGMMTAPRIYSTGTILYGAHVPGFKAQIDSLDDAKFHVQRLKDVGAISVKSYQQPRREQRQQVIAAGRELEIMVVPEGGAKFQANMTQIVDGHTGLEHAIPLSRGYEDVKQLWSQTESGYSPTFGVAYGGLSGETYWYDRTNVWENERLMRYVPRYAVEPQSIRRQTAPDDHYNHFEVASFAKELADLGVSVLIGAHGQREGLAAHWEMWMMEQGGFTPWEAIRGATIHGAHYVGLDGDVGSLEAGKLADLAIIEGNPLEDLRQSEYVTHTMINGRLYETATMNQIGNETSERQEFFFEQEGGDTIHPATALWLQEFKETHGWVH